MMAVYSWTRNAIFSLLGVLLIFLICVFAPGNVSHAAIAYVQGNSVDPKTPANSVKVVYSAAQTAGNLNVVAIGWGTSPSGSVNTVKDTMGNTYTLAIGPTTSTSAGGASIYYAADIMAAVAGANTVTVTFTPGAVGVPDVRIAEYSGLSTTNPVDVTVAAASSSAGALSSSGLVTTTNANDLLVGSNNTSSGSSGPGTNFTERIITGFNGNILEDEIVSGVGSYSATAPLSPNGNWIMQLVAFKAAGSGNTAPNPPTGLRATASSIGQINLTWTASTSFGVTANLIERCSGTGCTNFAQIASVASTATNYSDTGLTASTSYSYRMRTTTAAGLDSIYTATASAATSAAGSPPAAPSNLAATAASSSQINLTWPAPSGATGYGLQRCVGVGCSSFAQIGTSTTASYSDTGLTASTSYSYRVDASNASGTSGFSSPVTATTNAAAQVPASPTSLTTSVISSSQINLGWTASSGATGYTVQRCQGAGCTDFARIGTATNTSFPDTPLTAGTPYSYQVDATNATGSSGFSNIQSATTPTSSGVSGSVTYGYDALGRLIQVASPTLSSVEALTYDPAGNITGNALGAITSLSIANFSVSSASPGEQITIDGSGFSTTASADTVTINGVTAIVVSATPTQLVVTVPTGATSGAVKVTVGGVAVSSTQSLGIVAQAPAPTITSFSPSSAAPSTSITITGNNFSINPTDDKVLINGTAAVVTNVSGTSITATVPSDVASGPIQVVTPSGVASTSTNLIIPPSGLTASNISNIAMTSENGGYISLTAAASQSVVALFMGNEGDQYVRGVVTGAATSAEVLDPTGAVLGMLGSAPAYIDLPLLPNNGMYSVVATGSSAGGTIYIDVAKAYVTPLSLNWTGLNAADQNASTRTFFTFNGTQNENIQLELQLYDATGNPTLSLVNSGGTTIWTTSASSSTPTITLPPLPATGSYSLISDPGVSGIPALHFTAGVGATLTLDAAPTLLGIFPDATSPVIGQASFQGTAGQTVTFHVTPSPNYAGQSLPVEFVYMYYNDLTPTYLLTNSALSVPYSIQVKSLPYSGTYYININTLSGTTSPINVQLLSAPGGSNALDAGAVTVSLPDPGEMGLVSFAASPSGSVRINLAQSGSPAPANARVTVYGPGESTITGYPGVAPVYDAGLDLAVNNVIELGPLTAGQYYMYVIPVTPLGVVYGGTVNTTYTLDSDSTTNLTLLTTVSSALTGTISGSFTVSSTRLGQPGSYAVTRPIGTLTITNLATCGVSVDLIGPNSTRYLFSVNPNTSGSVKTNGVVGAYTLNLTQAADCTLDLTGIFQ